ncbi:MAG: hypothetical protein IPL78_30565 [Chloroflexi bacterium]|nr:hypothetical protein [Chloroflexota bacterium]
MSATPLLMTKLYCPPPRPVRVARPRLQPPHLANAQHRLTLITAPAGFGKTTLAAEWRSPISPGSLWDDEDNDPPGLWLTLRRASKYSPRRPTTPAPWCNPPNP